MKKNTSFQTLNLFKVFLFCLFMFCSVKSIAQCAGTYNININACATFYDETTFVIRNAANQTVFTTNNTGSYTYVASGTAPNNGPFTVFVETIGTFNDNCSSWTVSSMSSGVLTSGSIGGGQTSTSSPFCSAPEGETNVIASQCGFTMPNVNTIVYANLVSGAQAYRFRVTNLANNIVVEKDYALRNLYMSSLSNFVYNQTYSVEVAVKKAGVWFPYGASCNITTPNALTQLRTADCGAFKQRNDIVYANLISFAQGYRFKVVNIGTNSEQIIDRSLRSLYLASISDYSPIAFSRGGSGGNAYFISVAVKNTDGTYLDYGNACYVEISSGSASVVAREINQTEKFDGFKVVAYPNPFDNGFKLELNSNSTSKVSIVIYDMIGKQVENREINASEVNNIEIGSRLTTGIYNVILSQDENTQTIRMVKR